MNIKQMKRGGFTLMEVLIYAAILSITGTILSGVLINTTRIKGRQTAVIEVNEQLNFVLQNIQRSIMDSSVIDIENGISTSTLVLRFKEEAKNPTKFYISDNKIYKKEANDTPQPLTDDSVIATAVNFFKVAGYSGHDSLQIDLTLSYNTNNPTSAFSRTLSSAIARVSAATFDSDLIPGSSLRDIGTFDNRWRDMYLSGSININSTTASSTFANGIELSGGCFKYNGSCLTGSPALATGNVFVGNSSNTAVATSTIYLSTASNVGIGTTNPGSRLQVDSAITAAGGSLVIFNNTNTGSSDQARLAITRGADTGTGINRGTVIFGVNGRAGWADYESRRLSFYTGAGAGATEKVSISANGGLSVGNGYIATDPGAGNMIIQGNVGIGTTAPQGLVNIAAGSAGTYTPNSNATDLIVEKNGNAGISLISPDANLGSIVFGSPGDAFGALIRWDFTNKQFTFGPQNSSAVTRFLYANGAEGMRIDTNGNVGVGTGGGTPTSRLQVVGLPVYANNAAALAGGLTAGAFYRTGGDPDLVCVVH